MTDIRVLHVIDSLSPGGTERQCLELARSLSARGIENAVFYFRTGPLLTELEQLGVTVVAAPPVSFRSSRAPFRLIQLACMIRRWAPSIVQTYGFYSNLPGLPAAFFARVPVRVASRREFAQYLSPAQRSADRWAWKLAQRIVVNAEAVRQQLIGQEGVDLNKVVVIRNGLNPGQWPTSDHVPTRDGQAVVGMVARFWEQKDHVTFLRAAREILRVVPSVRFCLIGSGPLESAIREVAQHLGITARVDFCVGLEGEALRAAVRRFHVSVLSSKNNEGLPNAVLESMAAGHPVVATAVGGISEIIEDGVTGFLVPPEDPAALAERVVLLLKEPALARTMGEAGRQKVGCEFTMDRMADQFLRLYGDLLSERWGQGY
jgi:glycosyltransferase involved in cell wall biosynthesis